ncbi:nucleoside/nucleotide kinase family protein [Dermacoccaceae bacterium W4C1]
MPQSNSREAIEHLLGRLAAHPGRFLLGIAGAPGAGKSTLAQRVQESATAAGVQSVVVPMDGFHLAQAVLDARGWAAVKGAPHTFDGEGYLALLRRIRAGDTDVWAPTFNRDLEEPVAASIEVASSARLVITEGNYLLLQRDPWSSVAALLDESWLLRPAEPVRRERLVERHVRHGEDPARARERALGSDEANAIQVLNSSSPANLTICDEDDR